MKWGGDAVLLLFDAPDHPLRAVAAACAMQERMGEIGQLDTSGGAVELRMSIGVHSGPVELLLVGPLHRELIVTGPEATRWRSSRRRPTPPTSS